MAYLRLLGQLLVAVLSWTCELVTILMIYIRSLQLDDPLINYLYLLRVLIFVSFLHLVNPIFNLKELSELLSRNRD